MIKHNDIDDMAAEYVLGTLDQDERADIDASRDRDVILKEAINAWEKRLAPLNDTIPHAIPSPDLLVKIEQRLVTQPTASVTALRPTRSAQMISLRTLAMVASLAIVILASAFYSLSSSHSAPQYEAILYQDAVSPQFVVSLNEKTSTLIIRAVNAQPPANKSYQLWFIPAHEKMPHSLGITPTQDIKSIALKELDTTILRGATLAISVEPLGGSPTGMPTGPVIMTGTFQPVRT